MNPRLKPCIPSVVLLLTMLLSTACSGKASPPTETSQPSSLAPRAPSPPADRIAEVCDSLGNELAAHGLPKDKEMLRAGDDEFRNCNGSVNLNSPVKGRFYYFLRVESIWVEDGKSVSDANKDARESLNVEPTTPKLDSCLDRAECWLIEPDCAIAGTHYAGRYWAKGLAYPYKVEIAVGLWPDDMNKKNICEADRWSEKLAVKLLRHTLDHLLAKGS